MTPPPSDLVPWLEAFLDADHDASVDDAPERRAAFCSAAVAEGLHTLPPAEDPAVTRTLFKLIAHEHPSRGRWVAAQVSEATGSRRGQGKYHLQLVVTETLGSPRITGVYDVCTACVALGVDGQGAECIECGGLGWEPWFGDDLGPDFGPIMAVARVTKPATPLYHAAWKRGRTG